MLSVLGAAGTRIFSDELNHASIVDGCRLAHAEVCVYRHTDHEHLDALMSERGGPAVVVTDTVFSMDGDTAPLGALAEVCRRHGALLVLDEAHAVLCPEPGPEVTDGLTVVRVGTLSKALGAVGGFVAAPRPVVDLLVNLARPYIFTTAPTPADAAAALAALEVRRGDEGERLVARLRAHVERVAPRPRLADRPGGPGVEPAARWRPPRRSWSRGCGCRRSARRPCPRGRAGFG